jgi:hypothetical protein
MQHWRARLRARRNESTRSRVPLPARMPSLPCCWWRRRLPFRHKGGLSVVHPGWLAWAGAATRARELSSRGTRRWRRGRLDGNAVSAPKAGVGQLTWPMSLCSLHARVADGRPLVNTTERAGLEGTPDNAHKVVQVVSAHGLVAPARGYWMEAVFTLWQVSSPQVSVGSHLSRHGCRRAQSAHRHWEG